MPAKHSVTDLGCRIISVLVFLLGVGLLCWVFSMAYHLFNTPAASALNIHFTGNPKNDPGLTRIGSQFGWLLFRMGFLFLMAIAASLVSQKGINLYFTDLQHQRETTTKRDTSI